MRSKLHLVAVYDALVIYRLFRKKPAPALVFGKKVQYAFSTQFCFQCPNCIKVKQPKGNEAVSVNIPNVPYEVYTQYNTRDLYVNNISLYLISKSYILFYKMKRIIS